MTKHFKIKVTHVPRRAFSLFFNGKVLEQVKMVKWKCEIIFLIFTAVLSAVNCQISDNLRLPGDIVPIRYEIILDTEVHNDGIRDYEGTVKIDLRVEQDTSQVVLHHRDLSITDVKLLDSRTRTNVPIQQHVYSNETEFLTIPTISGLIKDTLLILEIKFNGKLQTGTAGFYRSQYQVPGENKPR